MPQQSWSPSPRHNSLLVSTASNCTSRYAVKFESRSRTSSLVHSRAAGVVGQTRVPAASTASQGKLWRRASEAGSSWGVDGNVLHITIAKAPDCLGSWPSLLQVRSRRCEVSRQLQLL